MPAPLFLEKLKLSTEIFPPVDNLFVDFISMILLFLPLTLYVGLSILALLYPDFSVGKRDGLA